MSSHLRHLMIAYGVAAVALVIVYFLTDALVVLTVLAVVLLVGVVHVLLDRRGQTSGIVDQQAVHESVVRGGNQPPERPTGI